MKNIFIAMNRHDSETKSKLSFFSSILITCLIFEIINYITKTDTFKYFEATKSMIFTYASASVWIGFSNTISIWSREQIYITHRIRSGILNIPTYLLSTCISQMILAIIQAILAAIFFPYSGCEKGMFMFSIKVDFFITFLLTIYGAALLGILLGLFTKTVKAAVAILPIILVIELLFSNGIFQLNEGTFIDTLSYYIHSRHAVSALGSLVNINQYPIKLQEMYPMISQVDNPMYRYSADYVLKCWISLFILCFFSFLGSYIAMKFVINKKANT